MIAKWKKPGYERLCSTYTINPRNYKFGTVSICRVPKQYLPPGMEIEDPMTGCRGCASGNGGNIFGNKYGQYLAAIQLAREERIEQLKTASHNDNTDNDDDDDNGNNDDYEGNKHETSGKRKVDGDDNDDDDKDEDKEEDSDVPVGAADGSSGIKSSIWAADNEQIELSDDLFGTLDIDAEKEAKAAAKHANKMTSSSSSSSSNSNSSSSKGNQSNAKKSRHS